MVKGKKRIKREIGTRRYKKVFFLSVEGRVTEKMYFELIKRFNPSIDINCVSKKNKSSPVYVLREMNKYLKDKKLMNTDEAWLVIDLDNWKEEHLQRLSDWSKEKENYGLAVSNPLFEYWLLLHFEDGTRAISANICKTRLKSYVPNYDGKIEANLFTQDKISDAVRRAKQQDNPPCTDWPRRKGTTVYRLLERILEGKKLEDD